MFNITKKKTIIGVIGLVASIVMAAVLGGLDGSSGPIEGLTGGELAVRTFCIVGIVLAFGFIVLILFDWRIFLLTIGAMGSMVVLRVTVAVEISVGIVLLSAAIIGGGVFGFTVQYRRCKYAVNGATTPRERQREEQAQEMIAEDEAFKRSIRYVEKSIVLCSQAGGLFQVIKTEREYYFHYIGSMFTKPDWSKCITDFDNIERYAHKKDYGIGIAEVESIYAVLSAAVQVASFGTLKMKLRGKKTKSYGFINRIDPEELRTFFGQETVINDKVKEVEPQENEELTDNRKAVLNKINLARYIFSVLSLAFFMVYTFFNTVKTDAFFTPLAIAICLAPIVSYLVLQEYITIRDVGRFAPPDTNKINFSFTALLFPLLFALKCVLLGSFTIDYEYLKLFLYSLIPLALLSVAFFVLGKEYKKFKSCIMTFLIAAVAFCPSFIYKANDAFDFNEPQEIVCEVTEMPTHTDNNGEVTYYLVIKYDGKTVETEVDEETYNETTVGGEVILLRYNGAFGIRSVYLK